MNRVLPWKGGPFMALLIWIGFVTVTEKGIRWPFNCAPWHHWKVLFRLGPFNTFMPWFGFFRNRPDVIKWLPGRLLPRRWGVYFIGFEFGDRG